MAFEKHGIKPGRQGDFAKDSTEKAKNMLKEATKEKTKGEKIRENLKEEIKKLDKIDKQKPGPSGTTPKPTRTPGEKKEMIPLKSGGRAMYKSGTRGCKLAMKGKGRAYGKNS